MKIVVVMNGGLINAVYTDKEAAETDTVIIVADHDVEGTSLPIKKDLFGEDVVVYAPEVHQSDSYTEAMFKLADEDIE